MSISDERGLEYGMKMAVYPIELAFFLYVNLAPACLAHLLGRAVSAGLPSSGFSLWFFLTLDIYLCIQSVVALSLGALGLFDPLSLAVAYTGLLLAAAGVLFILRPGRAALSIPRPGLPLFGALTLPVLLLLGFAAAVMIHSLGHAITDYDSLAYHLPALAQWYNHGGITFLNYAEFNKAAFYFYSWEALGVLFAIPFHGDLLVSLLNWLAWVLFGTSIYLVARELRAGRLHALAAAALIMTTPAVISNVYTLKVDLAIAAFFTASLLLLLIYLAHGDRRILSLFIVNTGLLGGIKVSAPIYSAMLIFLLLPVLLGRKYIAKTHPLRDGGRILGRACLWASPALALFLGAFWFVKDLFYSYWTFHKPFLFMKPDDFYYDRIKNTTLVGLFDFTDAGHWKILFDRIKDPLDYPFAIVLLLAILFPILALVRRPSGKTLAGYGIVALLLPAACFLYVSTPFSAQNTVLRFTGALIGGALRYGFPLFGLLGIAAGLSLKMLGAGDRTLGLLIAAIVVYAGFRGPEELPIMLPAVALFVLAAGLLLKTHPAGAKAIGGFIGLALLACMVVGGHYLKAQRDADRTRVYGGVVNFISDHLDPAEKLGYPYCNKSYIYRGRDLRQATEYVPSASDNKAAWLKRLAASGIRYVVVGPIKNNRSRMPVSLRELDWLEDPAGPFARIYGNDPQTEAVIFERIH